MKLTTKYNRHIYPVILIVFLVSITCSYFLVRHVLQNELDKTILRAKGRIEEYALKYKHIPSIVAFDEQHIIFKKVNKPVRESVFSNTNQYIPEQKKNHIARELVFGLDAGNDHYQATITQPLEGTRHLTIVIVEIAIGSILLITTVLLSINKRVLSRTWRPFYQSLQNIRAFRVNGHEKLVLPGTNIEEFKLMNQHFVQAAQQAKIDYRNLKEFSENASHETQTPLAIIRSNLDNLIQHESLTEKQSELIQSAYAAVSKLSKMQKALLLLTKIDNRQFDNSSSIDISLRLKQKIAEFNEFWLNKNIRITENISGSIIEANSDLLEILLNNLFSNATRHNDANGIINIICQQGMLEVSNSGDKNALDKERIFRRFYKASSNGDHNGLGLSIIKEICDASGIEIDYSFDNGLHKFSLTWQTPPVEVENIPLEQAAGIPPNFSMA